MKTIISILLVTTISLLLGCSKASHGTNTSVPKRSVAADSLTDWGMIEFSEGIPKHLTLNDGRNCSLTGTTLSDGNLLVNIETDKKATAEDQVSPGQPTFPVGTSIHLSQTMTIPFGEEISSYVDHKLVRFGAKLKIP
jgi:hypothetical protein